MKLYKFRSLRNVEFTLDILLSERLYCASFEDLNDPLEGIFVWKTSIESALGQVPIGVTPVGASRTLRGTKSVSQMDLFGNSRICSLTATFDDIRLWSHYADGHTGLAIEIDFDEDDPLLHEVEYVSKLKEFQFGLLGSPRAEEVLRAKADHWKYEHEYRIVNDTDFVSIAGRITGVYLGLRIAPTIKEAISRIVGDTYPVISTKLDSGKLRVVADD